jgi:hypothetical protein
MIWRGGEKALKHIILAALITFLVVHVARIT